MWRYSGIMGMLVCGEILTAIGASLFLHIKFGLPALISLLASLLALIYSSRRYMIPLENRSLHECPTGPYDPDGGRCVHVSCVSACVSRALGGTRVVSVSKTHQRVPVSNASLTLTTCQCMRKSRCSSDVISSLIPISRIPYLATRRLVEFLIPGPLTLLRYLLLIPVWPTLLVNMEALPFWPLKDFSFRSLGSSDVRWIWPLDWMGVVPPVWSFEGSGVKLLQGNEAAWLIAPHLLWTVGATIVTAFISICSFCSVYFDGTWTPCSARARWSWGFFFTLQGPTGSQDYVFHGWCARWQGLLGLGLTRAVCTVLWAPLLFIVIVAATLIYFAFFVESSKSRSCLEQELVFVFAHAAWWAIVAVVHKARHRNVFIQEDALPQRRPGR